MASVRGPSVLLPHTVERRSSVLSTQGTQDTLRRGLGRASAALVWETPSRLVGVTIAGRGPGSPTCEA